MPLINIKFHIEFPIVDEQSLNTYSLDFIIIKIVYTIYLF